MYGPIVLELLLFVNPNRVCKNIQGQCQSTQPYPGFPQALENLENLKNHQKKFHAWKNHGI